MSLNATDEQLDFPFIYASAKDGYAKVGTRTTSAARWSRSSTPSSSTSRRRARMPAKASRCSSRTSITRDYLGRIAFGKIYSGKVKVGDPAICLHGDGHKAAKARSPRSSISKA